MKIIFVFLVCGGVLFFVNSNLNGKNFIAINDNVTSLNLNRKSLAMKVGKTEKLNVIFTPNSSSTEVDWISTNEQVVDVANDGTVRAVGNGNAFIIVAIKGNYSVRDICYVSVSNNGNDLNGNSNVSNNIAVTKIDLSNADMTVKTGTVGRLSYVVTPSNATDKSVDWKSSDNSIVSVDAGGNIKTLKAGIATITVTSVSNPNVKSSCVITVKDSIVSVTKVNLNIKTKIMSYGETYNLRTSVLPSNATDKSLVYVSSKPNVVSVDNNGKIKVVMNKNDKVVITTRGKLKHLSTQKIISELITVSGTGRGSKDPHIAQGFCVAHVDDIIYMYAAHRDSSEKKALIHVVKRTVINNKEYIKEINKFTKTGGVLEHVNGMTYVSSSKNIFVSGIKKNNSFKYFKLDDSFSGGVNLGTSSFKNSNGKNVYIGAVAYDESINKYYIGAGGSLRVADFNRNVLKSTLKVDGKYKKTKSGGNTTSSAAQDVGAYKGKILVIRYNPGVSDSNSTVTRPRNAIDIYDGNTLEYIGTNIIKLGSLGKWGAELESVDYYNNGYFVIYYGYPGSSKNYVGHITKIKLNLG